MSQNLVGYKCYNGYAPTKGPMAAILIIDFATVATQAFDLLLEESMGELEYVQTLFIDNSQNAVDVTIRTGIHQQRIIGKTKTQGYYPALFGLPSRFTASTTPAGGLTVPIHLINVPMPAVVWTVT